MKGTNKKYIAIAIVLLLALMCFAGNWNKFHIRNEPSSGEYRDTVLHSATDTMTYLSLSAKGEGSDQYCAKALGYELYSFKVASADSFVVKLYGTGSYVGRIGAKWNLFDTDTIVAASSAFKKVAWFYDAETAITTNLYSDYMATGAILNSSAGDTVGYYFNWLGMYEK